MPYIRKEDRSRFDKLLEFDGVNVGELNFLITSLCKKYLQYAGENYKVYNSIIGVLECAKLEMYRRKVATYEDLKIEENGDVY